MDEINNKSFLGTGWSFPPTFSKETRNVQMVADEKDIRESLSILLSTTVGERVMQPLYGCNLRDLIFEPVNLGMLTRLENLVRDAIIYFEPRIKLIDIELNTFENEGKILITVNYMIRGTNSRLNYVYPFYLNEGTELKNNE